MADKRSFLVTGASGFIGGAIVRRLLQQGHRIHTIIRDGDFVVGCEQVRGDISDPMLCRRAVTKAAPDVVLHLAAQAKVGYAKVNRLETLESNVRGTYNLLEAVQTCAPFAKVVVASSDKAYGEMTGRAYQETDPLRGRGIYDVSKTCADLIAQAYGESCGVEVSIIRCGNVYGPGDIDPSRIVPSICDDLVHGRRPTIRSDGSPIRDYLYIEDAVDAYLRVIERMLDPDRAGVNFLPEAWNFASGEQLSVYHLTKRLMNMAVRYGAPGWFEPEVLGTRTGEIQEQRLNCWKATTLLGWEPHYLIDKGLELTLDWWYTP